ncbi:hypothetical protein IJG93_01815 [Candidatus Saccharibacteria bacterium]|nr:hypothetical protein [Candidatus Saccharibacteria bacterium]
MDTAIDISCSITSCSVIRPIALTPTGAAFFICPKGWTLPSDRQIDSIGGEEPTATYIPNFSPVLGGYYDTGSLHEKTTYGGWWGSTANSARRYYIGYNGSSLYTGNAGYRDAGSYIRCIQAS